MINGCESVCMPASHFTLMPIALHQWSALSMQPWLSPWPLLSGPLRGQRVHGRTKQPLISYLELASRSHWSPQPLATEYPLACGSMTRIRILML